VIILRVNGHSKSAMFCERGRNENDEETGDRSEMCNGHDENWSRDVESWRTSTIDCMNGMSFKEGSLGPYIFPRIH
jgi:hypothetical protein